MPIRPYRFFALSGHNPRAAALCEPESLAGARGGAAGFVNMQRLPAADPLPA